MLLSDEVLEQIADYLKMAEHQKAGFIDYIRGTQAEIFWKSFFMYYEDNKSPLELEYMQKLTSGLGESEENLKKLASIFAAEAANSPQMLRYVLGKMQTYVAGVLSNFAEGADEETKEKIVAKMFENIDVIAVAFQKGYI